MRIVTAEGLRRDDDIPKGAAASKSSYVQANDRVLDYV